MGVVATRLSKAHNNNQFFAAQNTSDNSNNMGKGQNEGGFSQEQLDMYKDCFKLMDINKDGTIDKNDLRGAFDNVGVLMSEGELDGLLGEISGACTYDNMVKMFQEKMAGDGNDSDDLIIQAFKAYDIEGKMDVKMFQHALRTWGDKMTQAEIDDVFGEFDIDEDYMVKTKEVLGLFVAQKEEQKKMKERPRRRRRRRRRLPSKYFQQIVIHPLIYTRFKPKYIFKIFMLKKS